MTNEKGLNNHNDDYDNNRKVRLVVRDSEPDKQCRLAGHKIKHIIAKYTWLGLRSEGSEVYHHPTVLL